MLLMIDNYDSFTYNLVQYFGELGEAVEVVRNDAVTLADLEALGPDRLVVSPGPCAPDQAGISLAAIGHFAGRIPILGVCLGHQCIGQAFGGRIVRAGRIMHGKVSAVHHHGSGLYAGLPEPLPVTRYHSLVIDPGSLPEALEVTSWLLEEGDDGPATVMGVRHREHVIDGVQFHPESILSEAGHRLLGNFLAAPADRAA